MLYCERRSNVTTIGLFQKVILCSRYLIFFLVCIINQSHIQRTCKIRIHPYKIQRGLSALLPSLLKCRGSWYPVFYQHSSYLLTLNIVQIAMTAAISNEDILIRTRPIEIMVFAFFVAPSKTPYSFINTNS